MRTLKFLLQKEFLQISRDKTLQRVIILLPLIQLLVLPWAATFEQRNISLAVVDNDKSSFSTELIDKVLSSGYFILSRYSRNYAEALKTVESNTSDLILEIPHGFERDFVNASDPALMLSINAVNGQKAGLGSSYLSRIVAEYNESKLKGISIPVKIEPYFKYNPAMSFMHFMVPGILVLLMTMIGGMLSAVNIVKEKETGTIEQINVTPVSKRVFITAKVIPFWIIGLIILTTGLILVRIIYGFKSAGGYLPIYIFAFVYLVAFTGFGLLVSTFSDTQQQALLVMIFFLMVFLLLGGLFSPISSMPNWAQTVTKFNPVRYFVEVIRLVFMKAGGIRDILPQLGYMTIFAVVFNVAAVINYRKTS